MRRHLALPPRRLVLPGALLVLLVICLIAFYSWPEETIDVALIQSALKGPLTNQSKPIKLGQRLVLRNLMMGLSRLQEEYREWQTKAEKQQREQYTEIQKRLKDLKAVEGDRWEALREDMREFQSKQLESQKDVLAELRGKLEGDLKAEAEEQRKGLEKQLLLLSRIQRSAEQREAIWEYNRGSKTRDINYTLNTLTQDSPDQWEQRMFHPYGAYGFVRFSAYRISRSRIAIVGLAARSQHQSRRLTWCKWHSTRGDQIIQGTLSIQYAGDHHNYMYEVVVLNCDLTEDLPKGGGILSAKIDSEIIYLYKESRAQALDEYKGPFSYELAYCSSPLFGAMDSQALQEFVEYHHVYAGAEHFVLYDAGGVTPDVISALQPYLDNALLSITDFRAANMWEVWLHGHVLAANDCLYRMRPRAKWVFMHDMDEYFEAVPRQTVKQLLQKYEDRPWLTVGCLVFSIHHCTANETVNPMLVSRMVYRWPHVYCDKATKEDDPHLCLGEKGHRKYIVNPRKVFLVQTFTVLQSKGEGEHLNIREARHLHFEGIEKKQQLLCDKDPPESWWLQYDGVSRVCQAVRSCEKDQQSQLCMPGSVGELEFVKARRAQDLAEGPNQ